MPAWSSSWMSCQRFCRSEPGALECASSSTTQTRGFRRKTASTSGSSEAPPRCTIRRKWNRIQAVKLVANVGAPVRLHKSDYQVRSMVLQVSRLFQHLIRLPDSGGVAEIDLKMTP